MIPIDKTNNSWASAMGQDQYGLWTEFEIENEQGEKIKQRLRWIPQRVGWCFFG